MDLPAAHSDLRTELQEIQSAALGRKFGLKDRRTIDPPPVVQVRVFKTVRDQDGLPSEIEVEDYSRLETSGLICHIDVFPLSPPAQPSGAVLNPTETLSLSCSKESTPVTQEVPVPLTILTPDPQPGSDPDPVIAFVNGAPLRESEAITSEAVGSRAVEAVSIRYEGRAMMIFTFPDLALRRTGSCFFRYRAFDLRSVATRSVAGVGSGPIPMLAECYALQSTVIYDSKFFPGLPYSTTLSKVISEQSQGPRPNIRLPKHTR
ncbi:hypothetical protein PUNSTDRAFT_138188 [Punctularia strigosozonata HHB-11173 SS5]|uniref:Velvet domain-containing protein n=1 Tax=Punctularia strigosozonata (strain HHB-11173) TaxID=741275 RepID=R7S3M5_PUNST|nr:uncharacterized protein PUNSTDRAFT_138188 [Punctularia strigosozonata HHB-11173 SS5]EIN05005.1 hypothetical protein PUNSTDRAFT_138188 [Punctularia strigosozonata HHB-11173 SS5]